MSRAIHRIDFMVPGLRVVSEANQREHWAVKLKRKKAQQEEISVAMQNVLRGRPVALPCRVKLTRIGARRLDVDNLAGSFKHCQDAIAKKLGVDDGDTEKVSWEYCQMPIQVHEYAVKIEIESARNGGPNPL